MRLIRMEPPRGPRHAHAHAPTPIADEFQPLFDARAADLRGPRPETSNERRTRLAAQFAADVAPLFDQTSTSARTTSTFTNHDLDTLLNG